MKPILPVSIIIPVSNRPLLIKEALNSIQNNTVLASEILIISNPKGNQDCQSFLHWLEKNPVHANQKINCIELSKKGVSTARNFGIKVAKNDYIAFLDSDDLWEPKKLEEQWNYLTKRPHLLACHTAEKWIQNQKQITIPLHLKPRNGRFLKPSFFYCLVSASSLLIHKKIFNSIGYFNENLQVCEDFELWIKILTSYSIGLIDQELTIKRSGDWQQLSQSQHSLDQWRILAILDLIENNIIPQQVMDYAFRSCSKKITILKNGASSRNLDGKFDDLEQKMTKIFNQK